MRINGERGQKIDYHTCGAQGTEEANVNGIASRSVALPLLPLSYAVWRALGRCVERKINDRILRHRLALVSEPSAPPAAIFVPPEQEEEVDRLMIGSSIEIFRYESDRDQAFCFSSCTEGFRWKQYFPSSLPWKDSGPNDVIVSEESDPVVIPAPERTSSLDAGAPRLIFLKIAFRAPDGRPKTETRTQCRDAKEAGRESLSRG